MGKIRIMAGVKGLKLGPRVAGKLTAGAVQSAKTPGLYADGDGLYLCVAKGGSRSWILRYRAAGKRRDMGLGSALRCTLAEARERARAAHHLLYAGRDPVEERDAARVSKQTEAVAETAAGITFAQVADIVIDAKRSAWSPKQEKEWRQSLRDHAFPELGSQPVAAIDSDMVVAALQPIWSAKPVTAKRVRQRIEAVLDAATAKKYRQGDNPARWSGNLEHLLAADPMGERNHHEALPYAEIADFMLYLPDTLAAKALAFTILTAARTGEVRKGTWSEIDLEARTWTVPAGHMKARRTHVVPLSDAALAILAALPRTGARVFPIGDREMWRVAKKLRPEIAVHGFRSTFSTWAQDTQPFPVELVEHCLAHITGDASERAYKRGDAIEKRRQVMDAWAAYCGAARW